MMTPDGTAKVTDFGLAKARGLAGESARFLPGRSILVSTGGMTPAYCSPEQAQGMLLSRKTDIWSWGLSVLEMFTGEVTWMAGQAAAEVLVSYIETGADDEAIPIMPEAVVELLRRCFQRDPEARPESMEEIVTKLMESYQHFTGEEYARPEPKAADLLADALNNRAVSMLDLGKQTAAGELFDNALEKDGQHKEAVYNRGLLLWRSGRMTDDVLVKQLEGIRVTHEGDWHVGYYLGLVHMERGDAESAMKLLTKSSEIVPGGVEVQNALRLAETGRGRWLSYDMQILKSNIQGLENANLLTVSLDRRYVLGEVNIREKEPRMWLWEMATGKCVREFTGFEERIVSIAISPEGQRALSVTSDDKMRLWEIAAGKCVRVFEGLRIVTVAISPDSLWGLSGSIDGTLRLWELATGKCMRTFKGHTNRVTCVSISPDGRWALSGSTDDTLRLWELATGKCLRVFHGHEEEISYVAISPDGRFGVSGSCDKTLRLWELTTGECVRVFNGHTNAVNHVAISPDDRWVLSGSIDVTLRLWELATGRCIRVFEGLWWTPFPKWDWGLSVGFVSGELRIWRLKPVVLGPAAPFAISKPQSSLEAITGASKAIAAISSARFLQGQGLMEEAAGVIKGVRCLQGYERHPEVLELLHAAGSKAKRLKLDGAWTVRSINCHKEGARSVAISPDSRWGFSVEGEVIRLPPGLREKREWVIRQWELATGQCVRVFEGHTNQINSIALSPDGRWALSGSDDKTLRLWELDTGNCLRTFEGHRDCVESVSISPDGRWGLSGSDDKTLGLWELATGQCVRTFEGHEATVNSVSISPDGRWCLSGSKDSKKLWDFSTGKRVRDFLLGSELVDVPFFDLSLALSPDGHWILSHGQGLWELATGRFVNRFVSNSFVNPAVFSPDGRWVFSGGADGKLSMWELATGHCAREFEGHRKRVSSLAISPNSRWLLSGSEDLTLKLWELVWDYEFPPPADWDEGARPYLESFLNLHTPYAAELRQEYAPSEEEIRLALTHCGKPSWNEHEFDALIRRLQYAGYGWLRPEGIQRELEKMTKELEDRKESPKTVEKFWISRLFGKGRK